MTKPNESGGFTPRMLGGLTGSVVHRKWGSFDLEWGSLYLLPKNIAIVARDGLLYTYNAFKSDTNTYLIRRTRKYSYNNQNLANIPK